jgi:hypothetical protein
MTSLVVKQSFNISKSWWKYEIEFNFFVLDPAKGGYQELCREIMAFPGALDFARPEMPGLGMFLQLAIRSFLLV